MSTNTADNELVESYSQNENATPESISLVKTLLESDAQYFELGAEINKVPGAEITWMPELQHIQSGCVIHRIVPTEIPNDIRNWVQTIEAKLFTIGAPVARFYLHQQIPDLEGTLESMGYQRRSELVLLEPPNLTVPKSVVLRPVQTAEDWEEKRIIHLESHETPDGHDSPGQHWFELEKRKSESGQMQPYLITRDGHVMGTVASMQVGNLIRLKNLVIRPSCRRMGAGVGATQALVDMAHTLGKILGLFAVPGGGGHLTYLKAGLIPYGFQIELTKDL